MSAGTAILTVFGVIFALVLVLIIWAIAIYNGLVSKRELVNEGQSSIDVQLKRRFNLIKNLVTVVKQYASHEAETLDNLTNARSAAYTDDVGQRICRSSNWFRAGQYVIRNRGLAKSKSGWELQRFTARAFTA